MNESKKKTDSRYVKSRMHVGKLLVVGVFFLTVTYNVVNTTTLFNNGKQALAIEGGERLDQIGVELDEIGKKIEELEGKARELAEQANTLDNEIARLQTDADTLTEKIDQSQKQLEKTKEEIALTEKKIEDRRKSLGKIMVDQYMNENITLIERLAGSENISEFIDDETKMTAASESLAQKVREIKALKAQLEDKKREVEGLIKRQEAQKKSLMDKKAEQTKLLEDTKGEEANYQNMRSEANEQRQALMQEQKKIMDELLRGQNIANRPPGSMAVRNYSGEHGSVADCENAGGYPYCNGRLDYGSDPWGLYYRECVSYAAWAMEVRFGKSISHFHGNGNGYEWPTTSIEMGARVDNIPEVGAVAYCSALLSVLSAKNVKDN